MGGYAEFEDRVATRLNDHLARPEPADEIDAWIDALVDRVLRDAQELGPALLDLFREELRPESVEAARQTARCVA